MFHNECKALMLKVEYGNELCRPVSVSVSLYPQLAKQNDQMDASKSTQHGLIRPLKERIQTLEAELDQTRVGYEDQIQTLTEALSSLNEQIAQRQDQLDAMQTNATAPSRRRSRR
eukprot:TRINITY_DN11913_c0_g5_i3.p1 TRINITY_DN11913_c0_g5~~TRINITY_DN11913_c0_g5_i3.p1  ORF type:complete len:115 (+),score=18.93 TRINITY_DN11913_c0_g5_i3:176-520(+)